MPGIRSLTIEQAAEVRDVYLAGHGVLRTSIITGVSITTVENIVDGVVYKDITGGRLSRGKRESAKWRGGRKRFERE